MELADDVGYQPAPAWESDSILVRRDHSFLRFLMPVAFPEQTGQDHRFEQRAGKLVASGHWRLLGGETQGFLPHVRMHFNAVRRHGQYMAGANGRHDKTAIDPAAAFGYIFTDTGLGQLSIPGSCVAFRVPGTSPSRLVEIEVISAQVGIFRLGVGFVALEVRPTSPALPDWLDALHFLRFYRGRGVSLTIAGAGADPDGRLKMENFLGAVLADAELDDESHPFQEPPHGSGRRKESWIRELYTPGELLTYTALFVDGVPGGDQRRLLYNVLHRFRSASHAAPAKEDGEDHWCLPYQQGQQFVNSIQGSAFVAFDAERSSFTAQTLPLHLRTTYFTLLLLALLQRFALDQLSESVARLTGRVLGGRERNRARGELEGVTALDSRLLDFTGRCYFVQVSQTAHHHDYYARLREVNQIEGRYREVTEEVGALRAHAGSRASAEQERASFRMAAALMVITCVLLPLQVIESLFATKLPELPGIRSLSPAGSAAAAGLVLVLATVIALAILYGSRRRRRKQS